MYLLAFLSVIAATGFIMIVTTSGGLAISLGRIADLPTIIVLILFIVPMLASSGLLKDFNNAFRFVLGRKKAVGLKELKRAKEAVKLVIKVLIAGSVFVACLESIVILYEMDDISKLGPLFAVILLMMVYGLAVSLLLFPVESILNVKIHEFISEEE